MIAPRSAPLARLGLAAPAALMLPALLLSAPLGAATRPTPVRQDDPARALFVANCASCHGENGDGQGTTTLDRPARSFQDGGFSFGNTPEALFKTISTGIPGSPMAGFDSSLTEEQRRMLAAYVVTLGPPVEEVKDEDMVLAVHDKPLVVRGLLPSLGEGLPTHPRGLLVGDPSGITFEYDVADVRLLALRQGGFVKRTDWSGRGGTPLEPLGKVVMLVDEGKPAPLFGLAGGARPLKARLSGTRVDAEHAFVGYHLMAGSREVAHVEESPAVETLGTGTGYVRLLRITAGARPVHLAMTDPTQGGATKPETVVRAEGTHARILARREGAHVFHALEFQAPRWSRKGNALILDLAPGQRVDVLLGTFAIEAWAEELASLDQ